MPIYQIFDTILVHGDSLFRLSPKSTQMLNEVLR